MLDFIDRFFLKYNTKVARERTKLEEEVFWSSVARGIAPVTLQEHKSGKYLIINDELYVSTIILGVPPSNQIGGYPKGMNESMINRLLGMSVHGSRLSISSKFIPISNDKSIKLMNKANFRNEIKQFDSKKKHEKDSEKVVDLVDESLRIERSQNLSNFKAILEDGERQFNSALILTLKSQSVEGLNILQSEIKLLMGSLGVKYQIPKYRHKETYISAQPYNVNPDYTMIQVLAPYAAVLTPSLNPNTETDKHGLFFGYDKITNKPVVIDIFSLAAQHTVVFGPTQSGKTFTMLMLLWRIVSGLRTKDGKRCRVVYLTPKPDENTSHKALVQFLGDVAELIETGPGGRVINPMQILYDRSQLNEDPKMYVHAYNMHKTTLKIFFDEWFKDTGTINMSNFIDYSLNKCYERFGIYRDVPSSWHNAKWPVLTDLFDIWEEEKKITKDSDDLKTIRAVLRKVYTLGEGGTLEYLNHQTDKNIDLSKRFIFIDMAGTPDEIKGPMRILIAGMMAQRFSTDSNVHTFLSIDEARLFLRDPKMANFLVNSLTMGASQKVSIMLFSQQATDLKKNNVAEEFQTNSFIKIVLGNNIDKINVKFISDFFGFNQSDEKQIIKSTIGEGMVVIGKKKIPMVFKSTALEHDVIKGKYQVDIEDVSSLDISRDTVGIDKSILKIVMDEGFCLDKWAPDNSFVQKWDRERVASIYGAGLVSAWVRRGAVPSNQSLDHFATVIQIACQLSLNGVDDVEIHHFEDVDIKFSSNGNVYAIEYERDGSHNKGELEDKRFDALQKYSGVMFVCASGYYPQLSDWLGEDFVIKRGQALIDYLGSF